jgi:hypothetical protein
VRYAFGAAASETIRNSLTDSQIPRVRTRWLAGLGVASLNCDESRRSTLVEQSQTIVDTRRVREGDRARRHRRPSRRGEYVFMAHKTVQLIIGRILTDEAFRERFVADPAEILSSLREMGYDLTRLEIDALSKTNRQLWQQGPDWIDARLQRCA